ncbi:MAG: hypothetical protein A2919_00595 [Candidatus Spechtbacteria bacterium RIFCSPLOWO2_01_FULL_43_12]|uniref:N-formylglutamate amidohydrolase n=1 Tax=Candidatus Spechtbacteria bacterium RIFCSPLOWO2_01_FULL_43_12 TaxID=1802162 RepID=A0A1G2HES0_9BACT|nr:MAG: hypothetical protein A2919_00595 [Candidatus Spechtbacteria bacterium RIFCSPLOWO2_01_FULL_43_12]
MKHDNINIIEGSSPVLISAPHAVPIKKNVDGRIYTRKAEKKVSEIVNVLAQNTGAWGIHTVSKGSLEGWKQEIYGIYKKNVRQIVRSRGVSLVVDIHAAKSDRPFYIDYDFVLPNKHPHDRAVESMFCHHYLQYFPSHKLSRGYYREEKGSGKNTLTFYVRNYLKIPAIQIEINKTLKQDEESFRDILKMLYSFIKDYENTVTRV